MCMPVHSRRRRCLVFPRDRADGTSHGYLESRRAVYKALRYSVSVPRCPTRNAARSLARSRLWIFAKKERHGLAHRHKSPSILCAQPVTERAREREHVVLLSSMSNYGAQRACNIIAPGGNVQWESRHGMTTCGKGGNACDLSILVPLDPFRRVFGFFFFLFCFATTNAEQFTLVIVGLLQTRVSNRAFDIPIRFANFLQKSVAIYPSHVRGINAVLHAYARVREDGYIRKVMLLAARTIHSEIHGSAV